MPRVSQFVIGYCDSSDERPDFVKACGSVTLITDCELTVLVDCGGPGEKERVMAALMSEGIVDLNAVTHVICTHGHTDHVGNLNLFPHATILLDKDMSCDNVYSSIPFDANDSYRLNDNITVRRLVGHTSQDLTVVVKNAVFQPHGPGMSSGNDTSVAGLACNVSATGDVLCEMSLQPGPVTASNTECGVGPGSDSVSKVTVAVVGDIFERDNDDEVWQESSWDPKQQEVSRNVILNEINPDWIVPGHGRMFRAKR